MLARLRTLRLLSLSGALQRRKMVCHVWFVTFVSMERCSDWSRIRYFTGVSQLDGQTLMADALERLKILLNSSTPIVVMETVEEMRAVRLVRVACSSLNLATFEWSIASGLVRCGSDVGRTGSGTKPSSGGTHGTRLTRCRRPGTLQQQGTRPGAQQPGGDVARSGVRSQRLPPSHGGRGYRPQVARRGPKVLR